MNRNFLFSLMHVEKTGKKSCCILLLLLFGLTPLLATPCGDVNSSGGIDIVDALMTAQYSVGLHPSNFDQTAAEVSGDGIINIVDALQIAQYFVGLISSFIGCATEPTPSCTPVTYELQAETAAKWDDAVVESDHAGFSGSGYVNTANATGCWIEWTVSVTAASGAEFAFRYAHESGDRPMDLSINGSTAASLNFPGTGAWTTWSIQTAAANLAAGFNTIRLTAAGSSGASNMDKLELTLTCAIIVTPTPTPVPTPTPEPTPTPPGWTPPSSITIHMIGDSTMADKPVPNSEDERGWGQMLGQFFNEQVTVANYARNGRSSRSFIAEGLWADALKQFKPDDWLIIQFGHNDQKTDDRHTEPFTTYAANLRKFANEAKAKGVFSIICTSIVRSNLDSHGDYPEAAIAVAKELNIPCIDLEGLTKVYVGGLSNNKTFYINRDGTHLRIEGAIVVCQMAVAEIRRQNIGLVVYLKE